LSNTPSSNIEQGVDELATKHRGAESLYLHVDVHNEGALRLYEEHMGFVRVDQTDPMYSEFTTSLNLHDGATRGRNHYLLCKHLQAPTWLDTSRPTPSTAERVGCNLEAIYPEHVGSRSVGFDISA
jgi:hypothetical protein